MNNVLQTIRPENLQVSVDILKAFCPLWIVSIGAILLTLAAVLRGALGKWVVISLSVMVLLGGVIESVSVFGAEPVRAFNGMLVMDSFSAFFYILFCGVGILSLLSSIRYLEKEDIHFTEYYVLIVFSILGMMLMVSALDFITLFIALELMSLSVYSLVGFRRSDRKSNEASIKYFILGGTASAVFLYGTALLYGATGSLNIVEILQYTKTNTSTSLLFSLGSFLVIVGFLFKVASAPFHMWMPDVYEGATTPITGFMTTALKAAVFATFIRVFISMGYGPQSAPNLQELQPKVFQFLWICSVVTMFVGNIIALTQTNLKRMLAYSSIAHTGYILVGFVVGGFTEQGYAPVVFYLAAYSVMNLGAFVVLTMLAEKGDRALNLHDLAGLSRTRPVLALSLAIFIFSMAGVPPTVGFIAKYWLFYAAVQAGEIWLVILAVLCSAISAYYYLRVLVFMYMKEPAKAGSLPCTSSLSAVVVAVLVLLTLGLGLIPGTLLEFARNAVARL